MSEEVVNWIEETDKKELPRIVIDYIDAGLTSIYQPPDVCINKPFKQHVCQQYEELVSRRGFTPGAKITVSWEQLVHIVENSYNKINQENFHKPCIRNAFDIYDLNPWSADILKFQEHLESLSGNSIYRALLTKQTDCEVDKLHQHALIATHLYAK